MERASAERGRQMLALCMYQDSRSLRCHHLPLWGNSEYAAQAAQGIHGSRHTWDGVCVIAL